jgi:phospholipid/cholesterol/gamma-HCH transport system substrate-binding protein
MPDQAKNMLIGIFVIAALAIIVFVLMFLHPTVGDEKKHLRVRFANIDKISQGTRVTFAGKPVGEVVGIAELPDAEIERKAINGFVYVYELTLNVDSSVVVFNTDDITARTSGLLGEKSVAIIPQPVKPGEELRIVNNEIIYARESGTVEEALKEVAALAEKIDTALDGVLDVVTTLKNNKFWENLASTASNVNDITTVLNDKKQWKEILANFHTLSGSVNETWKNVDKSVDHFAKGAEDFSKSAKHLSDVAAHVSSGEGTIGQLVMKDELFLRVSSLLSKAETTVNDINQYGLLFHLDKGWQRLRARRMNLLQKLSTPQEFRNYFNDEVDQITTSLERVSMILEQLDSQPLWCCYDLLHNNDFIKVYADLLRRITGLEEEIKMYNQQVVDTANRDAELSECCCQ